MMNGKTDQLPDFEKYVLIMNVIKKVKKNVG